jgi:tetratricopeptide (TPR) repeat protein
MASSHAAALLCVLGCALGLTPGCGGVSHRPVNAADRVAPALDLAGAKPPSSSISPSETHPGSGPSDPKVVDLDTIRIQVVSRTPAGETEMTSVATVDLFNGASAAWKEGRGDVAIGSFRQLVTEFPDSLYAPLSLHNIAAIYDQRGDLDATIAVLRELIAAYPTSRKSVEGHLYIAAILAEKKRWPEAVSTLEQALARTNLTFDDRVEALARKGYAQLELGQLDAAEVSLTGAASEWQRAPRIEDPYFIAMAKYYRGEVAHRRFLALKIELPDDNLGKSLAAKESLAATAYDRWRDALSHRHAYWATASGYQMSQVFFELWEATVRAPYPAAMTAAARGPYVVEVHERVRSHLEKALAGHQMNLQLAQAYGVTTSWSEASKTRAAQILEILAKEAKREYVQPTP